MKEAENGWLLAQLHGNFTPAHTDGCGARCFAGVQCASLISYPPQIVYVVGFIILWQLILSSLPCILALNFYDSTPQ